MVDLIGGNAPALPSGSGGRLGAHVVEVRPHLYLLCFDVIERYAGIELIEKRRHWYGGRDLSVRVTRVSTNADVVLSGLIGGAAGATERLPASLQQLPEGESHEGKTTIGRSRYLLMFPTLRTTVGLSFKIVAVEGSHTQYDLRATVPSNNPEQIMAELYRD